MLVLVLVLVLPPLRGEDVGPLPPSPTAAPALASALLALDVRPLSPTRLLSPGDAVSAEPRVLANGVHGVSSSAALARPARARVGHALPDAGTRTSHQRRATKLVSTCVVGGGVSSRQQGGVMHVTGTTLVHMQATVTRYRQADARRESVEQNISIHVNEDAYLVKSGPTETMLHRANL